jgi:hypothetical protein
MTRQEERIDMIKTLFLSRHDSYSWAKLLLELPPMVFKIMLTLSETEASGLACLATRDVRSPREQLRFLLRRELIQSGILPPEIGTGGARDISNVNKEI